MESRKTKAPGLIVMLFDMLGLLGSVVAGKYLWDILIMQRSIGVNFKEGLIYMVYVFLIAYVVVCLFTNVEGNLINRGVIDEMFYCVRNNFFIILVFTLILYTGKNSTDTSRGAAAMSVVVNTVVMFFINTVIKSIAKNQLHGKGVSQLLLITSSDRVEAVVESLSAANEWGRRIAGVCILDEDRVGEKVGSFPVVANYNSIMDYLRTSICDEVFINVPYDTGKSLKDFISSIEEMGIVVYVNINLLDGMKAMSSRIAYVHGFPTVEFSAKTFSWNMMFIKRLADIAGAIVGLAITIVITPFVAVPLLIESPGPLLFKQKRVGRNGRYFYIYKFRSMYRDAEERKKELMAQNEMKGAMFKMKDDPRITKVGKFIRATSIDELPQFWNILKGDMSLVGTRPPTVDEFKEYSPYHKRRLSLKHGLTGMWKVSGRSDIEDFEEVVRLDLSYIDNWSLALDLKILLKTFAVVFKRSGSR